MSEVSQNLSNPTQASERVFKALKEARSQLEAIEQARNERIAIVGMAGRFPGADNLDEFWDLLKQGKSGIQMLSDDALIAAGVPESTFNQPNYVRAYASFPDPTGFDAQFFGYSPREAELIDPQHRVFLECAWSALENAGYDTQQYDGSIGVYGGSALNSYIVNLHANPEVRESINPVQAVVSNVMGLMPTRVSYQLDLKGPSCGIQTGCSTALVAIHTACQSLLNHECDMALAGGVTVSSATPQGYTYQAESIASPDGLCRAFDANGQGTVFGNGVGIVVLKRLQAALLDGDHIHAVIAGSAINNDGADKVNLIAPSVSGQAAVIQDAIKAACVDPDTISYVEAHGTGTPLGDPIEVAALNKVFGHKVSGQTNGTVTNGTVTNGTENEENHRPPCALGSAKTNLGHLDAAAGAAGLIKTVLALQHKTLPASLNYEKPNPKIDFQNGPFVVNQHCIDWPEQEANKGTPKRAGVSSFGMGGTNAHAILEEAPERCSSGPARPWQLITLSAKTPTALDTAAQNLAAHLQQNRELTLADVAYTLQVGRRAWPHRRFYLCQTIEGAIKQLSEPHTKRQETSTATANNSPKSIVFMFSGQGAQHIDMARGLYKTEPVFKQTIDQCAELLAEEGVDLLRIIYPTDSERTISQEIKPAQLTETAYAQPALFAIEYALTKLWMAWGIQPQAMIGHSIGEYVAACVAGVFSLNAVLSLITKRGQLMQRCTPGSMLSVLTAPATLKPLLPAEAEIAVINSPQNCVVSGSTAVIEALQKQLDAQNIPCRLLATSHAFHSTMMEPALADFSKALEKVTLSPPKIDFISNVTGTWIEDAQATDADYWVSHLRESVRFSQGIETLLQLPNPIFLEVGPGHTLTKLVKQNLPSGNKSSEGGESNGAGQAKHIIPVIQSLPHPQDAKDDITTFMAALGQLWLAGSSVKWSNLYQGLKRHRLPLPTYPFERESYWVPLLKPDENAAAGKALTQAQTKAADMADWFYLPTWKRLPLTAETSNLTDDRWLIFADDALQTQLQEHFSTLKNRPAITWVNPGSAFSHATEKSYTLQPQQATDYQQLIQALLAGDSWPTQVIYGWGMTHGTSSGKPHVDDFHALVYLTQALTTSREVLTRSTFTISIITTDVHDVTVHDSLNPRKARVLGLSQVISQECPGLSCRAIDTGLAIDAIDPTALQRLCRELATPYDYSQRQIAYRDRQRWVQTYEPLPLPAQSPSLIQRKGIYLIAGDLVEGLGMVYAHALVKEFDAKLVLLGRPGLPAPEEWEKWLLTHGPQHGVSRLIRRLQALGREGEQFLWFSGNLAEADWVAGRVQEGIERFGSTINGVFHTGVMGDRASCGISQLTDDEYERITRTKIKGIQNLQQSLADYPVDFYVIQSSLSAIVGGIGFGAYAAANSYLDTYAAQQNRTVTRWLSLNWDACELEESGMPSGMSSGGAASSNSENSQGAASELIASELMALAISSEEVWQTTQRALAQSQLDFAQLVISPRDLQPRLKAAFTPSHKDPGKQGTPAGNPEDSSALPKVHTRPTAHTRPNLGTEYVAPRSPVEQTVAQAMGELLGIEAVGIHDNFFELGGHSLLAIQAVTQLRQKFPVDLPMRAFLFEAPTVAGIAKIIEDQINEDQINEDQLNEDQLNVEEAAQISSQTQSTIEGLLDQIEEMTPEEVKNEI
ncbi:MAG: beta-ketoacyl synthase N-terminal-like domain-containing protein [Cyanobacteria bacterium P01_F01_bin.53]